MGTPAPLRSVRYASPLLPVVTPWFAKGVTQAVSYRAKHSWPHDAYGFAIFPPVVIGSLRSMVIFYRGIAMLAGYSLHRRSGSFMIQRKFLRRSAYPNNLRFVEKQNLFAFHLIPIHCRQVLHHLGNRIEVLILKW